MAHRVILLSSLILYAVNSEAAKPKLQHYNVDASKVTVSGFSSGAVMATQFHFIHSSEVSGAGIVAGVPYCCGIIYSGLAALRTCMQNPALVNVDLLISEANLLESRGLIDATSNIRGDKVFLFQGSRDTLVHPPSGPNVEKMYEHYGADIKKEFTIPAQHSFPTNSRGSPCGTSTGSEPYLNNCGYKGAFKILNHLYGGGLKEPKDNDGILSNLLNYDQAEFFTSDPKSSSMSTDGFVYVPKACQKGAKCKLHIAFHGCSNNKEKLGNKYASKSGYMEVAELNNMIVLFPQTVDTPPLNPTGCWDWFGYLNPHSPYISSTKNAPQVQATYRMMKRVIKG